MRMALARDETFPVKAFCWEKATVLQSTRAAMVRIFFMSFYK